MTPFMVQGTLGGRMPLMLFQKERWCSIDLPGLGLHGTGWLLVCEIVAPKRKEPFQRDSSISGFPALMSNFTTLCVIQL